MIDIIVICCIFAFAFMMLLMCIACMSCLSLTSYFASLVAPLLARPADRPYSQSQSHPHPHNSTCFICMENPVNQVVTTCNHAFCGGCLMQYAHKIQAEGNRYRHDINREAFKCPACRKEIIVIFRKFEANTPQSTALKREIANYNSKFNTLPGFIRSVIEFPTILANLPRLLTVRGIPYLLASSNFKRFLLMLVYTLSPVDILPQAILGPIGLIDDGAVAVAMAREVTNLLVGFIRAQHRDQ